MDLQYGGYGRIMKKRTLLGAVTLLWVLLIMAKPSIVYAGNSIAAATIQEDGSLKIPNLKSGMTVLATTTECSVWNKPDSRDSANRQKKIGEGYHVTVYNQRFYSPYDHKVYYQTVKGKYVLAKCFVNVPGAEIEEIGGLAMYVCGTTANGTPIYGDALYAAQGKDQWSSELLRALNDSGVTKGMSDYDKAVAVANYLATRFDYTYSTKGRNTDKDPFTTQGSLHTNRAVCQGYCNAYCRMLEMLGIECNFVVGTDDRGGSHGWNEVVIDGTKYYVDVTYNSTLGKNDYLMLSYEQISRDHFFVKYGGNGYYDKW